MGFHCLDCSFLIAMAFTDADMCHTLDNFTSTMRASAKIQVSVPADIGQIAWFPSCLCAAHVLPSAFSLCVRREFAICRRSLSLSFGIWSKLSPLSLGFSIPGQRDHAVSFASRLKWNFVRSSNSSGSYRPAIFYMTGSLPLPSNRHPRHIPPDNECHICPLWLQRMILLHFHSAGTIRLNLPFVPASESSPIKLFNPYLSWGNYNAAYTYLYLL